MTIKMTAALLAATALTTGSAFASNVRFTGELSSGFSNNNGDWSNLPEFVEAAPVYLTGRGYLYVPINGTKLSFNVDGLIEQGWGGLEDSSVDDGDFTNFGGAVHLNYTQSNRYILGVVLGAWSVETFEENGDGPTEDFGYGFVAAEGKFLFDRAAFWAQAGYIDSFESYLNQSSDVSPFEKVGFARVGVNYYLEDDLKLAGQVGHYSGTTFGGDGGYVIYLTTYRVEMEQKVSQQFSVFGGYEYATFDGDYDAYSTMQHTFSLGIRARLGQNDTGTLLSHEATNSIGMPPVTSNFSISNQPY